MSRYEKNKRARSWLCAYMCGAYVEPAMRCYAYCYMGVYVRVPFF
jgi:hypothetical protein